MLKERFLTFSTSRFVSVLSHESIMITFYNKLPVLKVHPQNCIAHIYTFPLRTIFTSCAGARELVHTQLAEWWPFLIGLASESQSSLFLSKKRAFSFNAVITSFLYSDYRPILFRHAPHYGIIMHTS